MKFRKKKGIQLGQAFSAVLALVLVAILVIIAIFMFSSMLPVFNGTTTQSVVNESGWINGTGAAGYTNTSYVGLCGIILPSSVTAINGSSGLTINSGNYTINSTTFTIYNASAVKWNTAYFSFNYLWGGAGCTATQSMVTNFSNYPTLVGLVGTIIFLSLVIGVLVAAFAFGGREGV